MRCFAAIIALGLAACQVTPTADQARTPAPAAASDPLDGARLSDKGLGPIRVGMRINELRTFLGDRLLQSEDYLADEGCRDWFVDDRHGGVHLTVVDDVVVMISIHASVFDDPPWRTVEGIGILDTAADVRAAYPDAERRSAEYVPEPGHELFVWSDPSNSDEEFAGIRFDIAENQRVNSIHVGESIVSLGCTGEM